MQLNRLLKVIKRLGYRVVPVATRVDGVFTRRADIQAVYDGDSFLMTIPKIVHLLTMEGHVDLGGRQHPGYFVIKNTLYNKKFS